MACVGYASDSTSERVGHLDMLTSFTASAVTWPVSILPGSCSDGDKHFHPDIPFFFYVKKGTHTKQRLGHNSASLGISSCVYNYHSPTASQNHGY